MKPAFGDQLYARQSNGTPASIAAITADDLRAMHKLLFTRKGLKIAVVGTLMRQHWPRRWMKFLAAFPIRNRPRQFPAYR